MRRVVSSFESEASSKLSGVEDDKNSGNPITGLATFICGTLLTPWQARPRIRPANDLERQLALAITIAIKATPASTARAT